MDGGGERARRPSRGSKATHQTSLRQACPPVEPALEKTAALQQKSALNQAFA
jgi:hypothetical protein